jgi:hypothetical protein
MRHRQNLVVDIGASRSTAAAYVTLIVTRVKAGT